MEKDKKNLINCPVCLGRLNIREYYCDNCHTSIRGDFPISELSRLTREQLHFVKVFLLSQGNIKEVEKKLGISYPTVKNKLAEIIDIISDSNRSPEDGQMVDILEEIENGLLDVDEAILKINKRRNLR